MICAEMKKLAGILGPTPFVTASDPNPILKRPDAGARTPPAARGGRG